MKITNILSVDITKTKIELCHNCEGNGNVKEMPEFGEGISDMLYINCNVCDGTGRTQSAIIKCNAQIPYQFDQDTYNNNL